MAPELYNDFIADPNWAKYAHRIVAADYAPTTWEAQDTEGLVYDYASKAPKTAVCAT